MGKHRFFPRFSGPSRFGSVKGVYKRRWVEDISTIANPKISTDAASSHMGSSFSGRRIRAIYVFVIFIFLLFTYRVGSLQIVRGASFLSQAELNRQRVLPIQAQRGLIFDVEGRSLTKNIPSFNVALVPQDLPDSEDELEVLVNRVSELSGVPTEDIKQTLLEYAPYRQSAIVIAQDIAYDVALKIMIEATQMPGVRVHSGSKRLYLQDFDQVRAKSLSHVLGYTGKLSPDELSTLSEQGYLPFDIIGKVGVEKSYEQHLRGVHGRQRVEVTAAGTVRTIIAEQESVPGSHVRLTLDAHMQAQLEKIFAKHLRVLDTKRAAAIVMDPRNGAIRALISMPGYENNEFAGGISADAYAQYTQDEDQPLFNRAISGTYPSGSTIKTALAAVALELGVITPQSSFDSVGGVQVARWFFPDWLSGGHGITNVRKAIAWSVNTFFYYIGGGYGSFDGMGVTNMVEWLRKFGFSEQLGIDLPGERKGLLPTPSWKEDVKGEQWYIGDTYNFSIGQGDVLVTPLQIASMTSVVANGGRLYRPHVVEALVHPFTQEEKVFRSEIIRDAIIENRHLEVVRAGMRDCVIYGSCRRLSLLPFSSAGKTGTAQWSNLYNDHAWFTGFAPYEDPELVITVLVEEGGGGSDTAAPIAHEFLYWWGNYQNSLES